MVAAVGPGVAGLSVGQPVATVTYGGFSDYAVAKAAHVLPISEATPAAVAMLTSGLTASIGKQHGPSDRHLSKHSVRADHPCVDLLLGLFIDDVLPKEMNEQQAMF